ncbi:acyl-CoA thioesterase [Providencia manganoxydans]|uniref:acyl-CoA thioesterase n=1 Tax=Providencia manganoxydans TaxID=2923283 RepID=UPI0029BFD00D|nr:thioesterase family protein [Providencia manganoxydans]MDX4945583.1 thioesterase family protein [Providencia manganoxydans]
MATKIKVCGYHIDVFQHVNNARYLEFYETDRWAVMANQGFLEWALKKQLAMVVVNINVNYFQGAVINDQLTVVTRIDKINTKSALCYQQISRERNGKKELVSDAVLTFVIVDLVANKSVPLNGEILEKLQQLSLSEAGDFIAV